MEAIFKGFDVMRRFESVAVLKGGPGSEREVSLRSGSAVADGLRLAGLQVEEVDVRDCTFILPAGVQAVFPVLHGEFGEDGFVQRRLEEMGVPYVGSRSWEMPRSFDKEITHALLAGSDIPMPAWEMVEEVEQITLPVPLVLKAPRQGSSIGVEVVKEGADLPAAFQRVQAFGSRVLVEQFVAGRECTVGFLGDQPLPIVEILPAEGVYDYQAKYERGDTRYACPAELDAAVAADLNDLARRAFARLGGRHLGRVDFLIPPDGGPNVLELNTLPGFTATSLLPKAAAAAGIDFSELCTRILEMAE
jgi:D-alanine-D-alanine ligase